MVNRETGRALWRLPPKAENRRVEKEFSSALYSGCHCTPRAKARAPFTLTASTVPSGATASIVNPSATWSSACPCRELTVIPRPPGQGLDIAARGERDLMIRPVLDVRIVVLGAAVVHAPGQLVDLRLQGAAQGHIQLLHAPADGEQRHRFLERQADQRQGRGVALLVVRAARPLGWARCRSGPGARWMGCRSTTGRPTGHTRARRSTPLPSAGITSGMPPAASDTARRYLSPTAWKELSLIFLMQAGTPIRGLMMEPDMPNS